MSDEPVEEDPGDDVPETDDDSDREEFLNDPKHKDIEDVDE